MIPKIIHYCWFGRGPMPKVVAWCIESWKRKCPDYEIKLWNEDNFDVNSVPFVQQAYAMKNGLSLQIMFAYTHFIMKEEYILIQMSM